MIKKNNFYIFTTFIFAFFTTTFVASSQSSESNIPGQGVVIQSFEPEYWESYERSSEISGSYYKTTLYLTGEKKGDINSILYTSDKKTAEIPKNKENFYKFRKLFEQQENAKGRIVRSEFLISSGHILLRLSSPVKLYDRIKDNNTFQYFDPYEVSESLNPIIGEAVCPSDDIDSTSQTSRESDCSPIPPCGIIFKPLGTPQEEFEKLEIAFKKQQRRDDVVKQIASKWKKYKREQAEQKSQT